MKFLIVRFSSIGDIVLTSPVVRCLHEQVPGSEIHYLTKKHFAGLVMHDPRIAKVHTIEKKVSEVTAALKKERFDHIIDLHHNLRSLQVKKALGRSSKSFRKLNIEKWLIVNLGIDRMPDAHIVDRYLETLSDFGVKNDEKGLEFIIPEDQQVSPGNYPLLQNGYVAFVIGARFATKQMPDEKIISIIEKSKGPFVLLGGKEDIEKGARICNGVPGKVISFCGVLSIHQSASFLQQARKVITHDTGLMHIAAALKKDIVSVWGNTIPKFGMYPYQTGYGENGSGNMMEVNGLKCRPCSKLGYDHCPQGHFRCMLDHDAEQIARLLS